MSADTPPGVHGSFDPRFAAVADALAENLAARGELGAAVAVIVDGRLVVDAWCGWADAARTRPWREDTLVNAFSVGKAFAALCALIVVARGGLELEAPLARTWPEFAAADKEAITLRDVLGHRAGLAAIARELPAGALYDWTSVTDALAAQAPWWPPGTAHGYHVHTFGFIVGELVRRAAGVSIGAFLEREVAARCDARLSYGLRAGLADRCAEYAYDESLVDRAEGLRRAGATGAPELRVRAYANPPGATGLGTVNTAAWRAAEIPSANLHADARSIARVYAALIDEAQPLLAGELVRAARTEVSAGEDLVLQRPSRFGLGFQLSQPERPLGAGAGFGHFGAGGSIGFADPDAGLAFAYVMNRGGPQWQDPRNRALIDAAYAALAA